MKYMVEIVETFTQEPIQLHLQGLEEDGISILNPKTNVIWGEI